MLCCRIARICLHGMSMEPGYRYTMIVVVNYESTNPPILGKG
jgi:hypothetical protein